MKTLQNKYYRTIISLIFNLLISYIVLMLGRLVFFAVNFEYYREIEFSNLLLMLKGALVFDTSALVYINCLYILMMAIPASFKEGKIYQKITKIIFLTTNSIALFLNIGDSIYFEFTNRRTTTSVFNEFSNEHNIGEIIGLEVAENWYLILFFAVLVYLMCKFYQKPQGTYEKENLLKYYGLHSLILLISVPLCIFGMRGGIGAATRPITISNANQYVKKPIETALVLNTPFSLIRTIGKKAFVTPQFFTDEELEEQYSPVFVHPKQENDQKPLNVVVLIMESFGKEYIGALNKDNSNENYKSYTPFLDSLISESLTFKHSFANGRKSIDGMPSILSSIPMFEEPYFLTPVSTNKVSSIAGELRKTGYYTAFFHGAENGSMGFEAYSRACGFEDYFGRTEYGNDDDFDGRWAIWDEEFMQFFASTMTKFQKPFVSAIFTASSHHPFKLPKRYEGKFDEGTLPIHKVIGYSDFALRRFFETASKQPWYDNTLFVITADHTSLSEKPEYKTSSGIFSVPIIFYRPNNSELKGYIDGIAEQIDIMPSVLGYLNYDKPFVAFGNNLFDKNSQKNRAVNFINGIYQYYKGDHLIQFKLSDSKTIAMYDFVNDKLLKNNIIDTKSEIQQEMETELKAIIQQYMKRMNTDMLCVE